MTSNPPRLGAEAVRLLLEILECPVPVLSGAAAAQCAGTSERLISSQLLVRDGHEKVSASPSDHYDEPSELEWSDQTKGFTLFDPIAGYVPIPADQLTRHAAHMPTVIDVLSSGLNVAAGSSISELVSNSVWDLGEVYLGRHSSRLPMWFGRRLFDPAVQREVRQAMAARPHSQIQIILTSTSSSQVGDVRFDRGTVISLHDVVCSVDRLDISPIILAFRVNGATAPVDGARIGLSEDNSQLIVDGGEPILFKSDQMRQAIRILVDAHRTGGRVVISDLTHLGSMQKLFGRDRWKRLQPHLRVVNHGWSFDI